MGYSDLVLQMLGYVTKGKRKNIQGSHKDNEDYVSLYKGKTERHYKTIIVKGVEKKVEMISTKFGKVVSQDLAGCFLNEKININVANEKDNKIIEKILLKNRFYDKINPFGEKYFALGYGETAVIPRSIDVSANGEVVGAKDNDIVLLFANSIEAIPITLEYGEITETAIVVERTNGIIIQLHLLNEKGLYDVYECKAERDDKGRYDCKWDETKCWHTKTNKPLFQAWYPNVSDNKYLDNPIGTSVLQSVEDELFVLDTIFDKFHTEFKNGGMKRFISYDLTVINPQTSEPVEVTLGDEDVYIPNASDGASMVNSFAPALRNESFQSAMTYLCNQIGAGVGLGTSNYEMGANGRPLQTATAVIMKESTKGQTIMKNESLARKNIVDLLMSIKYVYNTCIEDVLTYEEEDIKITFADNVMEDTTAKKRQDIEEINAGIKSIAEYRVDWYGESQEDAERFVHENALLIDKYTTALQTKAITPKDFVRIVYGDEDAERIKYIEDNLKSSIDGLDMDYTDEDEKANIEPNNTDVGDDE